jgi:hypothetical protein
MRLCVSVWHEERERSEHEGGGLPELEHFPLNGGLKQLCGVRDPDFLHHVGSVRLDGLYADLEALGDFLILEASPDQLKDFLFAGGKCFGTSLARGKNRLG